MKTQTLKRSLLVGAPCLFALAVYAIACDDSNTVKEPSSSSSSGNASSSSSGASSTSSSSGVLVSDGGCFIYTNDQLINGTTTATHVDKTPVTPNRLADGGLPPIP